MKRDINFGFGFLMFASCSSPSQPEDTTVETQSDTIQTVSIEKHEIAYSTDSTTMNGYVAYKNNLTEKKPGILVVHEWWGHNDYARKRADMLAELGYVALAVDMYGDGKQASHPADAGGFAGAVMGNFEEAKARFAKAIETLKATPNVDTTKIAAIGYCFGGSVALAMANSGFDLDAVAAFHSGLQLPVNPQEGMVKGKVLICNGSDDPFIPIEQVTSYKSLLDGAGVDYKYVSYEGTVHAFTNPGADAVGEKFELPLKYNKESDEKSWVELQELLESVF